MGYWSEWSDWSSCSKQCSNGISEGVRTKKRSCINANVGDFGCNDSTTTEIKGMTHGDPSRDRSCDLSFGSIFF